VAELYSHSRLSSFENCAKKFHYRYVLRIPSETEGVEGFVGKRVHEVLERLYAVAVRGKVPSLSRVLNRYRQLWNENYDAERVRIVADEPLDHYRDFGERCLSNYYRSHYPFDRDETVSLESRVIFNLDDVGRYRVQGIIDRVARTRDGTLEIQDYKTSRRIPRKVHFERDRQLALYQIGLTERFGSDQPISLVWHYLATGQTRTSTRTPEQLQALREETIALIDRVRSETRFEPTPNALCRWCEYQDRCPAVGGREEAPAEGAGAAPIPAVEPEVSGQLRLFA